VARAKNCWELMRCGRETGGERASEIGICPAATSEDADGVNSGTNGGRVCWAVAGTLCGGRVRGTFATKLHDCLKCDFYVRVCREEGATFVGAKELLDGKG